MVERGGLENRCTGNSTEGSNPSLSAIAQVSKVLLRPSVGPKSQLSCGLSLHMRIFVPVKPASDAQIEGAGLNYGSTAARLPNYAAIRGLSTQ